MNIIDNDIFFSIIIPTRNRTDLFLKALDSVIKQSFNGYEILIIDDGSNDDNHKKYQNIIKQYSDRVTFLRLIYRPNGHGHCFARNYAVDKSRGKYVGFLDDDDYWTDTNHLANAFYSITSQNTDVDLYLTNQWAFSVEGEVIKDVWIDDLPDKLFLNLHADNNGAYKLTAEQLLVSDNFCHLNCIIVKKSLYQSIGGMDECLRYEPDRDIYLRLIDEADNIIHNPNVIARHNIPDQSKKNNASTVHSDLQKKLFQLRAVDKGILFLKNKSVISFCKIRKSYLLKHIAELLLKEKKYDLALLYAKEALSIRFSIKWLAYTLLIFLRLITQKGY
ncbi:MAG: glycosyltransferase [Methylovulum sp.]|nr:glycosyltransferase [Methylovulum sp.]